MYVYNVLVSMPITEEYKHQLRAAVPEGRVTFARYEDLDDAQLAADDVRGGGGEGAHHREAALVHLVGLREGECCRRLMVAGTDLRRYRCCDVCAAMRVVGR